MSDLLSSNNIATNDVDGRIGNKTWCKCECCAPMQTSIESVNSSVVPFKDFAYIFRPFVFKNS